MRVWSTTNESERKAKIVNRNAAQQIITPKEENRKQSSLCKNTTYKAIKISISICIALYCTVSVPHYPAYIPVSFLVPHLIILAQAPTQTPRYDTVSPSFNPDPPGCPPTTLHRHPSALSPKRSRSNRQTVPSREVGPHSHPRLR